MARFLLNKTTIAEKSNKKVTPEKYTDMILYYLQRHPGAADTLEGIVRWWLGQARIDISVEQVHEALEELIHQEIIKTETQKDGNILFRALNRNDKGLS